VVVVCLTSAQYVSHVTIAIHQSCAAGRLLRVTPETSTHDLQHSKCEYVIATSCHATHAQHYSVFSNLGVVLLSNNRHVLALLSFECEAVDPMN